eukprot:530630-Rhodomonas_salina.1
MLVRIPAYPGTLIQTVIAPDNVLWAPCTRIPGVPRVPGYSGAQYFFNTRVPGYREPDSGQGGGRAGACPTCYYCYNVSEFVMLPRPWCSSFNSPPGIPRAVLGHSE